MVQVGIGKPAKDGAVFWAVSNEEPLPSSSLTDRGSRRHQAESERPCAKGRPQELWLCREHCSYPAATDRWGGTTKGLVLTAPPPPVFSNSLHWLNPDRSQRAN